jgi:hypothetical protein
MEWGVDPIQQDRRLTDDPRESRVLALHPRRSMSTTQLIIVSILSLAVIALLMVRQRQIN